MFFLCDTKHEMHVFQNCAGSHFPMVPLYKPMPPEIRLSGPKTRYGGGIVGDDFRIALLES